MLANQNSERWPKWIKKKKHVKKHKTQIENIKSTSDKFIFTKNTMHENHHLIKKCWLLCWLLNVSCLPKHALQAFIEKENSTIQSKLAFFM